MAFIETPRFPESIRYGSTGGPAYNTQIALLSSGYEKRLASWSEARYSYNANLFKNESDLESLIAFFHVVRGKANGFRFKDWWDYKSCALASTPAFNDQLIGTGDGSTPSFQLIKNYTVGASTESRDIRKPVSGTVLLGIGGVADLGDHWSVDTTTGLITFVNKTGSISAATKGTTTTFTSASHTLSNGDTVYMTTFTGDWAALNDMRYTVSNVIGNDFDIDADSSTFAAYSSNGGQFDTLPQSAEAITAGYEFDVPVRFDTDTLGSSWVAYQRNELDVPLIEIRV